MQELKAQLAEARRLNVDRAQYRGDKRKKFETGMSAMQNEMVVLDQQLVEYIKLLVAPQNQSACILKVCRMEHLSAALIGLASLGRQLQA